MPFLKITLKEFGGNVPVTSSTPTAVPAAPKHNEWAGKTANYYKSFIRILILISSSNLKHLMLNVPLSLCDSPDENSSFSQKKYRSELQKK